MKKAHPSTYKALIELEQKLFSRQLPPLELANLVDNAFYEMGENGEKITKKEVVDWLSKINHSVISATNFDVMQVSEHVFLVTYHCQIHKKSAPLKKDWRSSIWKFEHNGWKLVYHQATPVK